VVRPRRAKNTPVEIVNKLNATVNAILADPTVKERFDSMGATLITGSAAEFGKYVAEETEKWAKVVKFSGAKPE
jgi:tripartite-type tricarboxylate transporter receptor subunit TctC